MKLSPELERAIRTATEVETPHANTYFSPGGTYLIATPGLWNDDGQDRDLIAIGRYGDVIPLSPTIDPNFLNAVKEAVK